MAKDINTSLLTKWVFITLINAYLVILAGGVVRSTGSGMGCPDWPKCFGQYIPPIDSSQLPDNYRAYYSEYRQKKNERFASYLKIFGMDGLSMNILNDQRIHEEPIFNATKTWVEFINRLLGALFGLNVVIVFFLTIFYFGVVSKAFFLSFSLVFITGFQGWLGSVVVSTHLLPEIITVHMLLALVLIAILIYQYLLWNKQISTNTISKKSIPFLWIGLVFIIIQIVLGTQVRQKVDLLLFDQVDRNQLVESVGSVFYIHRSFSWFLLIISGIVLYLNRNILIKSLSLSLLLMVLLLEVSVGVMLAYWNFQHWQQPLHLILASVLFGVFTWIIFQYQFLKINSWK